MKWLLIIASWLASLLVSGGVLLLASMFRQSVSDSDRTIGLVMGAIALVWLALPAGGTYLMLRTERSAWGIALLAVGVLGAGLLGLIGGAIGAAGQ